MERFHANTDRSGMTDDCRDTLTRKRLSLTGSLDTVAGTRVPSHCPQGLIQAFVAIPAWIEIAGGRCSRLHY